MRPSKDELNYIDFRQVTDQRKLEQKIIDAIENKGYIIIENYPVELNDLAHTKHKYQSLCEKVGIPISHDNKGTIVWDIKTNPNSNSQIKTYSEHNQEAELHTDSQYSSYPEDFFGLLTLKTADCGGGESFLLSLKDILTELRAIDGGKEIERILRETDFPFIIPNVFKKDKEETLEFNCGPILHDNEIRFRVDTFEKAIEQRPDLCTPEQYKAYTTIRDIILSTESTQFFFLKENDLVFMNNKTMLHGRSEYTDKTRHLLRIRMNKLIPSLAP